MSKTTDLIRVVIVDDEPLGLDRLRQALSHETDVRVVAECSGGEEAIRAIEEFRPDLVLLDVQMPEINGFDVIETVEPAAMPFVIFVTAYDEHAIAAFDANAVDYVVKPFENERVRLAVARARSRLNAHEIPSLQRHVSQSPAHFRSRLVVRRGASFEIVRAQEIDWVESAANYIILHIAGQTRLMRGTLGALEERLDPNQFIRVHRSTIVNAERVRSVEPYNKTEFLITLRDGTALPTSRSYRTRVRDFLKSFHG